MEISKLLQNISSLLEKKKRVILAIDGRCGAGKTTFASSLFSLFPSVSIIHMDDFFLPLSKKSFQRLQEPGGNIDYGRFQNEVIAHLMNQSFEYQPFSCKSQTLLNPLLIQGNLIIVEGSYSLHPYFKHYYDLSIFMDIDSKEQLEVLKRRSLVKFEDFKTKWIPLEECYFKTYEIKEKADYCFRR